MIHHWGDFHHWGGFKTEHKIIKVNNNIGKTHNDWVVGFQFDKLGLLTGKAGMHSNQSQDPRSTSMLLDFVRKWELNVSYLPSKSLWGLGGHQSKVKLKL